MFTRAGINCGLPYVVAFRTTMRFLASTARGVEKSSDSLSLKHFYPEVSSKDLLAMQERLQKRRSKLSKLTIQADKMEACGRKAEAAALHEKILAEGNSVSYIGSALKAARLYMSMGDEEKAMKFIALMENSIPNPSLSKYIEALKLEHQNRHEEASSRYRAAFEEILSKNILQSTLIDKT